MPLTKGSEEVVAYLLAVSTHLGAEAAVIVARSVQLALLGAGQARHRTSLDARAHEAKVGRRLPCQDAARGVARVGAVEVKPYAPNQVGAVVLAETGVGAGGTARDAIETLLNTAQEQVAIHGGRAGMQLEYLRKHHVFCPFPFEADSHSVSCFGRTYRSSHALKGRTVVVTPD
ncbi:MAG TPA: hypothetical protein VK771_00735 [Acidimicrobiia bacterium]|nr:hypothetical protein [Acidimicrobiia bacterium]